MQQFPCPFCGLRNEQEFHFAGEAGTVRPDTANEVSDENWSDYLDNNHNPKGETREIWVHLTCQEYFIMRRDSVTMEVLDTEQLRKEIK